jgi:8-oxo-dGTP pyrophosphatase MutT (NUDIX family)
VKALVERDGNYLLVKQRAGPSHVWTLPGGRVEFGERPLAALRREVREEVSLDVEPGSPVGLYDFQYGDVQVVVTVVACRVVGGEVDVGSNPADEEIVEYGWFPASAVGDLRANDGLRELFSEL